MILEPTVDPVMSSRSVGHLNAHSLLTDIYVTLVKTLLVLSYVVVYLITLNQSSEL